MKTLMVLIFRLPRKCDDRLVCRVHSIEIKCVIGKFVL